MYKIVVIVIDLLDVKNLDISFRLLFGKKLVMDGQNFKNFVITILQVNKIDPVTWSVSRSVIQTERQTGCLQIDSHSAMTSQLFVCLSYSTSHSVN